MEKVNRFRLLIKKTGSLRIIADCGLQTYQATRKLNRATTFENLTISAIIFILYWQL